MKNNRFGAALDVVALFGMHGDNVHDLIGDISLEAHTHAGKRMAEDLSEYLQSVGVRVSYMHSDIDTIERMKILRDLRLGKIDVLVGINLLREGLDLPEVSLVAILDADKEGFLRDARHVVRAALLPRHSGNLLPRLIGQSRINQHRGIANDVPHDITDIARAAR